MSDQNKSNLYTVTYTPEVQLTPSQLPRYTPAVQLNAHFSSEFPPSLLLKIKSKDQRECTLPENLLWYRNSICSLCPAFLANKYGVL